MASFWDNVHSPTAMGRASASRSGLGMCLLGIWASVGGCVGHPVESLHLRAGNTCDVRTCGAVGDGVAVDTPALQRAIDRVAVGGGGTVSLPPGRYVSGSLLLRDGVTLRVERGATLLGSTDPAGYRDLTHAGAPLPPSPYTQAEATFPGLLLALDAHDVAITGGGTIDGRGAAVAAAIHRSQVDHRLRGNPKVRPDESLRPCLINFVRCHDVRVSDVTLRDSACWVQDYSDCDGLKLDHVTVRSQAFWNNDGIDIVGCRHVRVTGCDIDSADDGICLKSNGTACDDVAVRNCRVRSWANAVKLGTASFKGFSRVSISGVRVTGSGHAGLAIESVDGGVIDGVSVSDMMMTNVRAGIVIKLGSRHAPGGVVGAIRNVTLSDVTAELAEGDPDAGQRFHAPVPSYRHNRFPCLISGLPGHPIEQVTLRRVYFATPGGGTAAVAEVPLDRLAGIPEHAGGYPEYGMHGELPACGWFVRHAAGVAFDDVGVACFRTDFRAAAVFDDVYDLDVAGLHVSNAGGAAAVVAVRDVRGAVVHGGDAETAATAFVEHLDGCDGVTARDNALVAGTAAGSPGPSTSR